MYYKNCHFLASKEIFALNRVSNNIYKRSHSEMTTFFSNYQDYIFSSFFNLAFYYKNFLTYRKVERKIQ